MPEFDADAMLTEFSDKFGASKDPELWKRLIREERTECVEAATHLLKELADLMYVTTGALQVGVSPEECQKEIGAPLDLLVELLDTFGPDVEEEAFRRVHASNMSKLGADGKPIRRDDGKVLKGPNYLSPQLEDLVDPSVRGIVH